MEGELIEDMSLRICKCILTDLSDFRNKENLPDLCGHVYICFEQSEKFEYV